MKRAVFILAACSTDPMEMGDELVRVNAFAGEHHVVGVDSDHAGGVWVAYQLQSGPFSWNDLRLAHHAVDGTKLAEHRYQGDDVLVSGIAFDGEALWVSHSNGGDQNNRVRKIDPATGAQLAVLPTSGGIEDVAVRGAQLLFSRGVDMFALNATTGALEMSVALDGFQNDAKGIAVAHDGTWIVEMTPTRLSLVDDTGVTLATLGLPSAFQDWSGLEGIHLAVEGDQFIVHRRNQISWYARTTAP